jgi:hypothetical protein
MSPSEAAGAPSAAAVPPEVLAIAVALALEWQSAEAAAGVEPGPPSPWRWAGRRWERPAGHRWS